MRPKRKILIIDANEDRRSVLAYTLEVKGFRTYQAAGIGHARTITLVAEPEIDLVLAYWPLCAEEFMQLRRANVMPCLAVIGNTDGCPADMPRLVSPTIEELLNTIIVATKRKKGPKKKVQQLTAA